MNFAELARDLKHGTAVTGQTISQHRRAGYCSPDAFYEGALLRLIGPNTRWLDAGCGASPCPFNPALAVHLSGVAKVFTGVDPGPNLAHNRYVHRAIAGDVTSMPNETFELVTMRMAAEHVAYPQATAAALHRLVAPGGVLLIFTVHAASPTALLGRLGPHRLHRTIMRLVFGGANRDVFPTYYRMNTLGRFQSLLTGFALRQAALLDDCRMTIGFPRLHAAELMLWKVWRQTGLPYPECCILAEFIRNKD